MTCPDLISALILTTAMASLTSGFVPVAVADGRDTNPEFDLYCMSCHGPDGRGINGLGLDLVTSKFVAGKSEAALVAFLEQGRLADDPASVTGRPMPGFSWVTQSELKSVAAFIKARNGNGPVSESRLKP